MAYRIRILNAEEAAGFAHMTFPAFIPLLTGRALAIGAYSDGKPVGLALTTVAPDRSKAELLSLYVDRLHRLKGMATQLLLYSETMLRKAGTGTLHTRWSGALPGAKGFEAVLIKRAWSAPKERMLVLHGNMDIEFGNGLREMYPKCESPNCLPRSYRFFKWKDMSDADRAFIRSKEGQPNWYAPRANPFREEEILEPSNSLVLCKDDEITGWLTVHRTAPDTFRYTDVCIREDLKRAGAVAIALVTHAFWLQLKEGTPKLTMGVEKGNEPLVRMYQNRMSRARLTWTWGACKHLNN